MNHLQIEKCMSQTDLKQLLLDSHKRVKILDVRSKEEYDEQHIPGAIHSIISKLELETFFLKDTDYLITVCGKGGGRALQAAQVLQTLKFKNVTWLCGGTFGWFNH